MQTPRQSDHKAIMAGSARFIRKWVGLLFFLTTIMIVLLTLPAVDERRDSVWRDLRSFQYNISDHVSKQNSRLQTTKRILAWTTIFKKDFLIYHNRRAVVSTTAFSNCPEEYRDCEWTLDKSKINSSDAVVFHVYPKDFILSDLPHPRDLSQLWVYLNLESPIRFMGEFWLCITYTSSQPPYIYLKSALLLPCSHEG